jgi:hypothetical protein
MVDDYSKHFIALPCRDTTLSKPQQIQLLITGLGDPLRTNVALQQPASLEDTIIFMRTYEQQNASHDTTPLQLARSTSRYTNRSVARPASSNATAPTTSATSVNKPVPSSMRLSPSENAQRRKDTKCFKCDELFTPGH